MNGLNIFLFKGYPFIFFPRSSFLEAKESPGCSYVWRRILAALPILRLGSCWGVGNGSSISVVGDRWLPNHPTNKILYPRHELVEDLAVSDLIDPELHIWRRDMIMGMFHKEDAEAICRIPSVEDLFQIQFFGCTTGAVNFLLSPRISLLDRFNSMEIGPRLQVAVLGKKFGRYCGSLKFQVKSKCLDGELAMIFYQHPTICHAGGS